MKVAAITDDGKNISLHFGRAQYYLVVTVEDGVIVDRELRVVVEQGQAVFADHHGIDNQRERQARGAVGQRLHDPDAA